MIRVTSRLSGVFVALLGLTPGISSAQTGLWDWSGVVAPDPATVPLSRMLAHIPAALALPSSDAISTLGFGDFDAARRVLAPLGGALPLAQRVAARAAPHGRMVIDTGAAPEAVRATVGFTSADIGQIVLYQTRNDAASVLTLAPAAAARVPDALLASGYARVEHQGLSAFAVGDEGALDREAGRQGDPFRGLTGRSARIAIDTTIVRHGESWTRLASLTDASLRPASETADVRALVGALDGLNVGSLLEAVLYPQAARIVQSDPVAALRGTAPEPDHPVWRSLMFADFSTGPQSTGVMVLTADWPQGLDPAPLPAMLTERWSRVAYRGRSPARQLGAWPQVSVELPAEGLLVLRISVTVPTETSRRGVTSNPVYDFFIRSLNTFSLTFLP